MTKRLPPMFENPSESEQLRGLIEAGRNARVSDYDFEQGLRRHLSQIEAGAPLPHWAEGLHAGGAAAVRSGVGSLLAWVGAPIVTASVVAAYLLASSASEAPAVTATTPAAPVMPMPAPVEAAPDSASAAEPEPAVAPQPVNSVRESGASERGQRRRRAERASQTKGLERGSAVQGPQQPTMPRRTAWPVGVKEGGAKQTASTAPAAQPQAEAIAAEESSAAREAVEPAARAQTDQPAQPAKPEPARLDDARLEREMGMLATAQNVLLSDPARAWKLARQGELEFGGSMFTEERQQLLLLSLVRLGRLDEAKRLAQPYLARYPNGPFSERVRRALATGRVER